ncbi:hypothetical protein V8F33_005673 [Rhypophila sp. PSN 637]
MPILQLLQIPLESAPSTEQQPWRELASKLASASDILTTLWAPQHENNKIGGIAATWKSLSAQKAWSESAQGKEFKADIEHLGTTTFSEDIIMLAEDPAPTFTSQVVEVVWWIHPVDGLDDAKPLAAFKEFQKIFRSETDGGLVAGWGEKEFDYQGVKTRRFYCLIGWKSVDAHLACKQTPVFAENIHFLRDHGHIGVQMVHYPFRAV